MKEGVKGRSEGGREGGGKKGGSRKGGYSEELYFQTRIRLPAYTLAGGRLQGITH